MSTLLTKSKFKLSLECPTKLFYYGKDEYYNSKSEDAFMQALAEGGFQVGELAKLYYPGGEDIEELDPEMALKITNELLQSENVTIYEGAFRYGNLFIRADIICKKGNEIRLIEVKAKSFDSVSDSFTNNKNEIRPEWRSYLYDVAFQKYVIQRSRPEFRVVANLLLCDKSSKTTVNGLNQFFLLHKNGNRMKSTFRGSSETNLGRRILVELNCDDICEGIINGDHQPDEQFSSFEERLDVLSDSLLRDVKVTSKVHSYCKKCEFQHWSKEPAKISGFHECWKVYAGLTDSDFDHPLLLDIWDFRKSGQYLERGRYFMKDIAKVELEPKTASKSPCVGLSRVDRQWLQVRKAVDNDPSHYLDVNGLTAEMATWRYPLHFIDFETSAVAIPFNAGMRPYEQVAFQFSHHKVYQNGSIEHATEWISTEPGKFPNFDFIRELKKALDSDSGSIFRYSNHENTILCKIREQLKHSQEGDRAELCQWIESITKSTGSSVDKWEGERNMIDLCEMVKRYYYHPMTKGSNSIKYVIPAVLNTSEHLKEKYSKPIYGQEIPSRNFSNHIWVKLDTETVINPYELLPPILEGFENDAFDRLFIDEDGGIADGGAAMMAYARMQFTEMGTEERELLAKALLRYCELDTFAMVLLWEAWYNWCK